MSKITSATMFVLLPMPSGMTASDLIEVKIVRGENSGMRTKDLVGIEIDNILFL